MPSWRGLEARLDTETGSGDGGACVGDTSVCSACAGSRAGVSVEGRGAGGEVSVGDAKGGREVRVGVEGERLARAVLSTTAAVMLAMLAAVAAEAAAALLAENAPDESDGPVVADPPTTAAAVCVSEPVGRRRQLQLCQRWGPDHSLRQRNPQLLDPRPQ